jgi:aspartyl protease family protein
MFRRSLPHAVLALACCMGAVTTAQAQSVAMTGVMGSKALLIINGGPPKALSANERHQGVLVLQVQGDSATIEMQGRRQILRMGSSPVSVGQGLVSGRKVVLRADSRGHFKAQGFINAKPMQYMVDTGASVIGMGQSDAERMGLDFQKGQLVTVRTANGNTQGWHIKLDTVRVGDITVYGVDAVVSPQPMPFVLLGNSFLAQLHMTRQGNEMVLEHR